MRRLVTFFGSALVLGLLFSFLLVVTASAASQKVATPLGGCTPYNYHLVSKVSDNHGSVEIYADGCGWVRGHYHSYSYDDYVSVALIDSNGNSHSYTIGSVDAWTGYLHANGTDYYAYGEDHNVFDYISSGVSNGYYYP